MCFDCDFKKVAEVIDDMLKEPEKYGFAENFLSSVRDQARDRQHVTPKQKQGVRNVWTGAKKGSEKKREREDAEESGDFPRRYEGFETDRHGGSR